MEYSRLGKVDFELVSRALSYGGLNVVALLPNNIRLHFAVFILSVIINKMLILAFFVLL